ncbi:MAG: bifunctional riboflavin kinase/FAD synthetase [Sulfurimonas sp.]
MKLLNKIKSIAIGSFDGLHRGHQALIAQVEALVIIERNGGYLTPGYKRSCYTDRTCCFYHFDKTKGLSAEAFVARVLEDFPHLEKIVVGYDFHFGKNKGGNGALLKKLFEGEVTIVDQVSYEGIPVHSRTIKQYLKEGNVRMANALLGREYLIEGEVIRGQGLGKKELLPTINLFVDHYQLPREGVYATRTSVGDQRYASVTFIGHRVSTDGSHAVETHLLNVSIHEHQVTESVTVEFVQSIRQNRRFDDLKALKAQIMEDIRQAKVFLG